jgi:hypothetical protein
MYLHLGNNYVVRKAAILAVFDLDNSSQSHLTRQFLLRAEKAGQVFNAAENELPKSFVVCAEQGRQTVWLSQLNASTLLRRSESRGVVT